MVQIPESHPSVTEGLTPVSANSEVPVAQQQHDHTDTVEDFGYSANQNSTGSSDSPDNQKVSGQTSPDSEDSMVLSISY